MDTTLRDGEQTRGVSFATAEKISIAKSLLTMLKVDRIEVASAGVSEGEKEAVSNIFRWANSEDALERVEVLGFVDHKRSVDWIVSSGGKVLNLLTKGSEKHCREQLRRTLDEHIADIKKTIAYALQKELIINVYLEDWSNGYKDSREYVYGLMDGIANIGIKRFMLPDTLGVMTPHEVSDSLHDMCSRYAGIHIDFHAHNDYGLATANCMAAVDAGVKGIHCTVNCLGERAGNVSLAEVAVVLRDKMNVQLSIDETKIYSLSGMVENFSGKRVADNAPVIGSDVFTQTSGIHADGDHKGNLYKTELSPERFARKRAYALGKMSGKASLIKNLEELGISLAKEDQALVLERVVKLGDSKEQITKEDLPFIIADTLESKNYNHIKLLNCSITSGLDLQSVVSVKVELDGKTHKSTGHGNGGFDAFIMAIKPLLQPYGVEFPELLDYEIRIPKGGRTSALTECFISWQDPQRTYRTRGVDANQVFAGIYATMRMLNMKLHEHKENAVKSP